MMRTQRKMLENGGSLGCLSLEVSRNITQHIQRLDPPRGSGYVIRATEVPLLRSSTMCIVKQLWHCSVFFSGKQLWLPPVWKWQRRGRGGRYREEGRGTTTKEEICFPGESQRRCFPYAQRGSLICEQRESCCCVVTSSADGCICVFDIPVGLRCLGHQLKVGSEGPEEGEDQNEERGEEESKERAAESAGWESVTFMKQLPAVGLWIQMSDWLLPNTACFVRKKW